MKTSVEFHGRQEMTLTGEACSCTISRRFFGSFSEAIVVARLMMICFDGLRSVDAIDPNTGEVFLTVTRENDADEGEE